MRKTLFIAGLMIVFSLALATVAYAGNAKYTFNDVGIDGELVEIEASLKTVKKGDYTTCSYYSDDYADYLGYYDADVFAGDSAEEILDFCVTNFDNRSE